MSKINLGKVRFTYEDFTPEQLAALKGDTGEQGLTGADGATFTPSVDAEGNLSWTNDKGLVNPPTVNIKGDSGVNNIDDNNASTTTTYSSTKIETIKEDFSSQIKDIDNVLYGGISSLNNINLWEQGAFQSSSSPDKIDSPIFIRTKEPISKDFDDISLNTNINNVSFVVFNGDRTVKKWLKYEGDQVYFSTAFKDICLFSKDLLESHKKKILDILLNSQDYPYAYILLSNTDNSAIDIQSYNNLIISKNVTGLTEVFQNVSNGKKLIASAITDKGITTSNTDTFQIMADNISQIESSDRLLYKFGVVSDNHCAAAYNGQNKMVKVLNYYNNSDVDFVCSCGDVSTDNIEHLDWLKNKMTELNFSKPFYAVRGNHDSYLSNEQWKSYFGQEPNFTFNKGDDMFIFLSIDYNCDPPYNYNDAWAYLQTLDVTDKRVFLIQHLSWEEKAGMRSGEVYGFTKDHEIGNNIYNYFPKNLIAFTGHSHYIFECEEQLPKYDINVYNENRLNKTVVHCPSTGYAVDKNRDKIIDRDIIQGWVCEVYGKKVILKAIDFNTGEYMSNYTYTINTF